MLLKNCINHLFILLHFSIQLGGCTIATIKSMFLFFLLNIYFAENFNNYLSKKISDNINDNDEKKELLLKYKGLLIKDKNNVELLSYFILYFKDIVEIFNKFNNIPSEEKEDEQNNNNECNCEEWPNSYSDEENDVNENDVNENDVNDDENDVNDDESVDTNNTDDINIFNNCEKLINIINPPLVDEIKKDQ